MKYIGHILHNSLIIGLLIFLFACSKPQAVEEQSPEIKTIVKENTLKKEGDLQNGDIIFHSSLSLQSKAIQIVTNSKYSHVGIIYIEGSETFVYEAIQPVKLTPLSEWIARGENGHYVVKRLREADKYLTSTALSAMKKIGEAFEGKNYDIYFNWSDAQVYCSELVWKVYKKALNIELAALQQLGDLDLSHPLVQAKLKERYGTKLPLEEPIITPAAIFESQYLQTVFEN